MISPKIILQLERAGVEDENGTNTILYVDYRISKLAWLFDENHKYIAGITERIRDMTGLSMESAEALQVVNYGIGGFYDTHFDYAQVGDTTFDESGNGNRIGTVMFYVIYSYIFN